MIRGLYLTHPVREGAFVPGAPCEEGTIMAIRRIVTAVLVVTSAVLTAPVAGADTHEVVIESANGTERVWQQTRWDGNPTITADFRDSANQYWLFDDDSGTFQNGGTGLCATAVSDRVVAGRYCNGNPAQRWQLRGDYNQRQIQNVAYRNCVTYEGNEDQLLLRECDWDRINQRWYLND